MPDLKGKIDGGAIRVPTPNVSLVDVTFEVAKNTTVEEVNKMLKDASEGSLKNVLGYTEEGSVEGEGKYSLTWNNAVYDDFGRVVAYHEEVDKERLADSIRDWKGAVYDDYVRDGGEQFTVIITDKSYTPPSTGALYEDVTIDTTVVTTTITDNPAQDTENPGTPTEPTDPEDPTDTPSYGTDDSVYVRILDNDVASEGDVLTHKVQLVDASGNAVTVPTGETITITLTYAGTNTLTDTDSAAEAGDYTAIKTVTILGGTSETSFTNTAVDDYYSEGIEEYTVTVATAAQANASFENVAIDTNQNSVTELGDFVHHYTHFRLDATVLLVHEKAKKREYFSLEKIDNLALSGADRKALALLKGYVDL